VKKPHLAEAKHASFALLPLLPVMGLEISGFLLAGSLVLAAHLADVVGDSFAYLSVIVVALVSWYRDLQGREHKTNHIEQIVSAVINATTILVGVGVVSWQVYEGFTDPGPPVDDWIILAVPAFSFLMYWIIHDVIEGVQEPNVSIESLKAHVVGDRAVSAIVFIATLFTLSLQTSWANPAGGVAVMVVLGWVFAGLVLKIREAARENQGVR